MPWLYLTIAIFGEIVGTSALKVSDGFTRLVPSSLAVVGYGMALYFLALALRGLPLGIAYAVWAGTGTAVVALIGLVVFGQRLDAAAWIGIALIVSGVFVLNALSTSGS